MKKTRFAMVAALALFAMQAAGCIFVTDDEDEGYFHATWQLTLTGGGSTTCAQQGADGVSFLFTDSANNGTDEIFSCAALAGNTNPLPVDQYTLSVSLLDANDQVLGQSIPIDGDDTSLLTCDSFDGDLCVKNLPLINFQF
jgi:hypothetical protein